jgi:hypothetical protein
MSISFRKKSFPPGMTALLIGCLCLTACASTGTGRGNQNSPTGAAAGRDGNSQTGAFVASVPLPVFIQELRVPLWEAPPLGILPENAQVLTVSLELIDLAGNGGEAAALRQLFQKTFYRNQSPQDYAQELIRVQTREYRDMGEEARNNPDMARSATLNWNFEERFQTNVNTPRLLVISRNRANYTGGAHGSYDKQYFVFDREVAAPVRLSDVIREESRPALKVLANRKLRADKKLGPNDSLQQAGFFVDEAELTDNYFLSPQGLGFHWDPYEVAPYSDGFVEAIIPYGEIKNFLSPEGLRLAQEFNGE